MIDHEWEAPLQTTKAAAELYPSNRENIRVLDVAAGTGMVATEVKLMTGTHSHVFFNKTKVIECILLPEFK